MNSQSDQELLQDFARRRSEEVFAELVRRHVDLVYSAALRMVRDAHLAEDVTQSVFATLAQSADKLVDCSVLAGWLHRTTRNLAAKTVRSDVRRRFREQEVAAMNRILSEGPDANWEEIAPDLDDALNELGEADRDAILLRYFQKKSAREMAQSLGVSNEAAQKRVNRAVERLRNFFAKRGVSIGTSGLVAVVSANAVQAAPVGLITTISAATVSGTTIVAATLATSAKAVSMTTLQKSAATVALAAMMGTPLIFQQQALNDLRSENENLAQVVAQVNALREENAELAYRDSQARELAQLQRNHEELLKLREEVAALIADGAEEKLRLRQQLEAIQQEADKVANEAEVLANDGRVKRRIMDDMTALTTAIYSFTRSNNDRIPERLEELLDVSQKEGASNESDSVSRILSAYLAKNNKDTDLSNIDLSRYELIPENRGILLSDSPGTYLLIREKNPRLVRDGWQRIYGRFSLTPGNASIRGSMGIGPITATSDSPDFTEWENEYLKPKGPDL